MFHDAYPEDVIAQQGYKLVKLLAGKYGHERDPRKEEDSTKVEQAGSFELPSFFSRLAKLTFGISIYSGTSRFLDRSPAPYFYLVDSHSPRCLPSSSQIPRRLAQQAQAPSSRSSRALAPSRSLDLYR